MVTITKIKYNILLTDYAAILIVNSTVQLFFRKVFGSKIFTDMWKIDNYILNQFKALEMRQHLDTKFIKMIKAVPKM